MSASDVAISIRGLSKSYAIRHEAARRQTFGEAIAHRLRRPFRRSGSAETFCALNDVSFDVKKGEVVGIVGRNGAGKSTLLKVLSRITEPTAGKIRLHGRVGSLLEVGTGFHPELTGRENIFLNGTILGMRRPEIVRQFDAIVDFAGVEKFLDTPVKRYSSGMYVRLAFAVAAHMNPEILVIDEVLAVGDMQFQEKCLRKMDHVARAGRTILFVSHNLQTIRTLCTRCILLGQGQITAQGDVDECLSQFVGAAASEGADIASHGVSSSDLLSVRSVTVNGAGSDRVHLSGTDRTLRVAFDCLLARTVRVNVEARLADHHGATIAIFSPGHFIDATRTAPPGPLRLEAEIVLPKLNRGTYLLSLSLSDPNIQSYWEAHQAIRLETDGWPTRTGQVLESGRHAGMLVLDGSLMCP